MEYTNKNQKESLESDHFFCKKNGKNIDFIGFKGIQLKFEGNDLQNLAFEDNQMYMFKNLVKKGNNYIYSLKFSSFIKDNGIIVDERIEDYDKSKSYSITGKVIGKDNDQIFLLLSGIKEIVLLKNIVNKFEYIEENQYIKIYYAQFISKNPFIIDFKFTDSSLLLPLEPGYKEKKINEKVVIKLKLLDFDVNLNVENILLKKIEIESQKNYNIDYQSYDKFIYYVYDASYHNNEYFDQKINLYFTDELYPIQLKFFVYKSFMNEANLYVTQKGCYAYEYLYFSLDNSLPNNIELESQPNILNKFDNFHSFNSKIRKSIIFLNIPPQNKLDEKYDKSFLRIFLCKKDKTQLYGNFSLRSIEYKKNKEPYKYDPIIEQNIIDVYDDYIKCIDKNNNEENKLNEAQFIKKYFSFGDHTNKIIENKLSIELELFQLEDKPYTLKYFNSLCFWNLCNTIIKLNQQFSYLSQYIDLYNKIVPKENLNSIEKIGIFVTFIYIALEDKNNIDCPIFYFYNDLPDENPYKTAFKFQYEIIDHINEESCLFQPFLFLDSYIMDNIYCKGYTFISKVNSAYSISMLTLDLIKEHLKKSIKPYFFVLEKTNKTNKRKYYAAIHKFSKIIIYNENILLKDSNFTKMHHLDKSIITFQSKFIQQYAFKINLENIHENFSHGKETIINIKESPTLYFDRNMNISNIYNIESPNYGEAGRLVEEFICGQKYIEEMKANKYDLGDFLKVKYFVAKDFNELLEGFKKVKTIYDGSEHQNIKGDRKQKSSNYDTKVDLKENNLSNKNNQDNLENRPKEENLEPNIEIKPSIDSEEDNVIYLSKYNTYTLTAENYEDLNKKIEEMKKKKIIRRDDAINCISDKFWY